MLSFITVFLTSIIPVNSQSFLSVGDWGAAMLDPYHAQNVKSVVSAMKLERNSEFTLNTGDNFYYCGIQNISDKQVDIDFIQQFGSLQQKWYNVLGNHDYGYNASAQTELNTIIPNWIMDDRYYMKQISANIILFALDTNPCIQDYRNDNPYYWDPCGSEYPTCSLDDTNDDFEGECKFHENILTQDCTEQFTWFNSSIYQTKLLHPNAWIIVIGHHPVYEINVEPFYTIIDQYADLYLNGHTHLLNYYSVLGKTKYITTGAGGMVSVKSAETVEHGEPGTPDVVSHDVIWTQRVAGYSRHNIINNTLITEFIDWKSNVLSSFEVTKH